MVNTYTLPDTLAGLELVNNLRESLLLAGYSVGITHEDIGSTKYPAKVITVTATPNKSTRRERGLWTGN